MAVKNDSRAFATGERYKTRELKSSVMGSGIKGVHDKGRVLQWANASKEELNTLIVNAVILLLPSHNGFN